MVARACAMPTSSSSLAVASSAAHHREYLRMGISSDSDASDRGRWRRWPKPCLRRELQQGQGTAVAPRCAATNWQGRIGCLCACSSFIQKGSNSIQCGGCVVYCQRGTGRQCLVGSLLEIEHRRSEDDRHAERAGSIRFCPPVPASVPHHHGNGFCTGQHFAHAVASDDLGVGVSLHCAATSNAKASSRARATVLSHRSG